MNYRAIIYFVGKVLRVEAVFLLLPFAVSLYYREADAFTGFVPAFLLTVALIGLLQLLKRFDKGRREVYAKDGFVLVAICWIVISVVGATPFYFSGAIPSFMDSLFESVSGFTTTGATVVPDVDVLSKGMLFWRCLSQWIGGMGVLVFLFAVGQGEQSLHMMKAESPGPSPGKLVPRLRQSSKILYSIYLGLTVLQVILLLAGGMPVFDSLCNAMSTACTGGFSITKGSIAVYGSDYINGVIAVFMLLFGVNFNLYYLLLIRNFTAIRKSEELRAYGCIYLAATVLVALNLYRSVYDGLGQAFGHAAFQVSAMLTTTGFATVDFYQWPTFSRMLLLLIMLVGACAGSTSGGIKVSRLLILLKEARRRLFRIASPRSVEVIKLDGKVLDKDVIHAVTTYFSTLCLLFFVSVLVVSLDNNGMKTTSAAVIACLSNVGIGLDTLSPLAGFSGYSLLSKMVLSLDMLIGRLEIYPIILLLTPRVWRRM